MRRLVLSAGVAGLGLAGWALWPDTSPTEILQEVPPVEVPKAAGGACPPGAADAGLGPDMQRLPQGFCIDETEVTRGQYEVWLGSNPQTTGQASACAGNDDFTPTCDWSPGSDQELPVVCVDWCDAKAFCDAAGKRLCGKVGGGGSYPFDGYDDPAVSEWHAACTSGGQHAFTYGDGVDTVCRDADADDYTTWGLADVSAFPDCHSPEPGYAAVYNLSGLAAEWEDSCQSDAPDAPCRIRGGSFEHHAPGQRCDMGRHLEWPRTRTVVSVGFRCCAD